MAVLQVKFTKTKREKLAQILWIFNWISLMSGIILFSLGLFLKVEIRKRSELMPKGDITSAPSMLISVGVIACFINFLGGKICYDCTDNDKCNRWKLIMFPYILCAFCFTFCILGGVALCYTMKNDLEESLYLGLKDAMRFYKDTDIPGRCSFKQTIDTLQIRFQCCGNNGFKDWFEVQWVSVSYLDMASKDVLERLNGNIDGKYLVDGVPFSCCNLNSPRPCIQYQLTNNSAHYNYDFLTEDLNIWMKGCREVLLEYYAGIMKAIVVTVFLIWLFELSVLIGVRYLQTAMTNVVLMEDPQCDSDDTLRENDFVETAKYNISVIKNIGNAHQVSMISGMNVPNMDVQTANHGPQNIPTKSIPKP